MLYEGMIVDRNSMWHFSFQYFVYIQNWLHVIKKYDELSIMICGMMHIPQCLERTSVIFEESFSKLLQIADLWSLLEFCFCTGYSFICKERLITVLNLVAPCSRNHFVPGVHQYHCITVVRYWAQIFKKWNSRLVWLPGAPQPIQN